MTFDEVLEQGCGLLQSKGRVAYRALKRRFELDEGSLSFRIIAEHREAA